MDRSRDDHFPGLLTRRVSRRSVLATSALVGASAYWTSSRGAAQTVGVTKRVAAVDATAAEKSAADYRCDGRADYVEIAAALAALPATGGTILLSSGHFVYGDAKVLFKDRPDITVQGAGMDVTFVSNYSEGAYDSEPLSFIRAARAVVRDLTISAGGSLRTTADALDFDDSDGGLVENVKVVAGRGRGIVFDGKDPGGQSVGNVIRGCVVTGCTQSGIQLLVTRECEVIDCEAYGNGDMGLRLQYDNGSNQRGFDNVIRGGLYHDNAQSGIGVFCADGTLIDGARCTNNQRDGIRVQTTSQNGMPANGTRIVNCVCTDTQATKTQDYGVNLYGVPESEINGTVIRDNDLRGNRVGAYKAIAVNTTYSGNSGENGAATPTPTRTATGTATRTPTNTPIATATSTPLPGSGLFSDGFESGSFAAWSSVSGLVVQQAQVGSGKYAARGASSGTAAYARKTLAAAQTDVYFKTTFRLNSKDSGSLYLTRFRTAGNLSLLGTYVSSVGKLSYRNDISGVSRSSTTSVALGSWHTLETHVVIDGAAGRVETWLNGVRIDALCRTENLGTAAAGVVQIGDNASGRTFDYAFDDVKADTACVDQCPASSSPQSTATSTPEATATTTSTPEPAATKTSTPEATATKTSTPEPTATKTSTPEPTSTRTPTKTPEPTATKTPEPTSTATATSTPAATAPAFRFEILSPTPPPSGGTVDVAITLTAGTVPVRVNVRSTNVTIAVETPDTTTFRAVGERQVATLTDQTGSAPGGRVRLQAVVNNVVAGQTDYITFPAG